MEKEAKETFVIISRYIVLFRLPSINKPSLPYSPKTKMSPLQCADSMSRAFQFIPFDLRFSTPLSRLLLEKLRPALRQIVNPLMRHTKTDTKVF
ncbi:hypothetical protein CEXT_750261 [Caerostris extrusa]|uniref:Uncharacterized protein n=1 Tax=Caerostris extrusa TaxID=172846 RepID=A0AAV4W2V2_CAEEX|nr:hypothetical protein CEXT_750261 [Caerostris extrusa]